MALRKNDPYKDMESGQEGVRPGFLRAVPGDEEQGVYGVFSGRKKARSGKKSEQVANAAEDLADAEEEATSDGGFYRGGESLDETKDAEEEADGYYSGSGKDSDDKKLKVKRSKLSLLKRGGPSFGILGIIIAIGGLLGGAQSMLPFAIEEMIIEKFNSIGVSSTLASDAWLNTQLNYGVRVGNTITNSSENLFAFSHFQVQQFESQGIKVIDSIGTDTTSITALLYLKNNEYIPVVGSDFIGYDLLVPAIKEASGLSNIGTPIQAKDALADPAFKVPYTTASKAWRGGGSGWFDNIMSNISEVKMSITRTRWTGFARRMLNTTNETFKEIAAESEKIEKLSKDNGLKAGIEGDVNADIIKGDNGQNYSSSGFEEKDGFIYKKVANGESEPLDPSVKSIGIIENKTETMSGIKQVTGSIAKSQAYQNIYKALNSKAVAAGMKIGKIGCGIAEALVTINTLASAYQSLQFLNLITGFLEAVDRVKAGDSDGSVLNEYSSNFTREANTYNNGVYNDDEEGELVATNRTALQSQGLISLFSGSSIIASDASVNNVNFESLMAKANKLAGNISVNVLTFEACGYVKTFTDITELAITIVSLIPVFQVTSGIEVFIKLAKDAIVSAAIGEVISFVVPKLTKYFAQIVMKNVATEWFGEDLGNALYSGASKYLGGNATSGGQSAGDKSTVLRYLGYREQVIAEEAEYQRAIRSPFDITSPYTFLGSLAYSAIPLASSNSLGTVIKSFSGLASNSLVAVSPISSAYASSNELTSLGSCPLLESVGAVGDAFCNPYIVTDTSTLYYSPVAIAEIVQNIGENERIAANGSEYENRISANIDSSDGHIIEGSELAKYLTYCGQRSSALGLKDATIMDLSNKNEGNGSTAKTLMQYVPGVGDIMSIIDDFSVNNPNSVSNLKWSTGQRCVASSEGDSEWQEKTRFFQRYAENERLLENMNPGYKSKITTFFEKQYAMNPIDQSFEGTLARFSGMSKEQVEDTLALIEYYEFLDQYDPTERLAFVEPKESEDIRFDNDNKLANVFYILLDPICYSDVRNRAYTV